MAPPRLTFVICCLLVAACGGSSPPDEDAGLSPMERAGKAAFFDASLSEPPGTSCASCHDPARGFSGNNGGRQGVPLGSDHVTSGIRNTPSAMYARFAPPFGFMATEDGVAPVGGQFLDGRADTLEAQARLPLFAATEMNNASEAALAAKVAGAPYAPALAAIFGNEIFASPSRTVDALTAAMAAFERSARFAPFSSKYDAMLMRKAELSAIEVRGLELFMDPQKGNCAACHAAKPDSPLPGDSLFTDFTYDNLGVPRNRAIAANADPSFFDLGLCGPKRPAVADQSLCGAFKVPTLRNTSRKTAWMHNGFFSDLRDVVAFYATRDTDPSRWYPAGTKFDDLPERYRGNVNTSEAPYDRKPGEAPRLDDRDIDAIVAFLRTLEDGFQAR